MEKNAVWMADKKMYFIYIHAPLEKNSWSKNISFGYYKINFFIKVNAKIVIDNAIYCPHEYDFMTYPPYSNHYGFPEHGGEVEYFELLIPEEFFNPCDPDGKMTEMLKKITQEKYFSLPESLRNSFAERFYALRDNLRLGKENVCAIRMIFEILFEIDSFCGNQKCFRPAVMSEKLSKIVSYMRENFAVIGSIKEVCNALYVSRAYLSRLFKSEIGCTPYEYLSDIKLEYSMKLLDSGKNVTEACFESGFNNCSIFIEAFKKRFGITPGQYARGGKQ